MSKHGLLTMLATGALAVALAPPVCAQTPSVASDSLQACGETKDLDRAIAACSRLIGAGSRDAQLYERRGFAYLLKGDLGRALTDLDAATIRDPKSATAFSRRGLAYRSKGEDDRAIADFTRALSLGASDPSVFIDRGTAHLAKGDNEKAIADYTTAIERDADKTFVSQLGYVLRGIARLYSDAPSKAQADFTRATDLNPKEPFFAMWLHIAQRRNGSTSSLASAARNLDLTRWPGPAVRMFLGEETPEAVVAVKGGPVTVCEADYFAAEFQRLEHRDNEALRLYRKALSDCPRHILEGVAAKAALRSLRALP